jgi:pSer/pThr/pTyr-binding forkhead associated (FHA) protein
MRLTVKRGDDLISELRFSRGPIYIGRQIGSQIFLPDKAVSRQHTVIYTAADGKWMAEDLDSANKTYLNDEAIHKVEIKNGDILTIAEFRIEIHIDESDKQGAAVNLEDTLHSALHEPQVVLRRLDGADAPPIKMQAKRGADFSYAVSAIYKSTDMDSLVATLLDLIFNQFMPFHVWVAVRTSFSGAMEVSKGRKINGQGVKLEELNLGSKVNEAVKSHHYVLVSRLAMKEEGEKIGSAMIAPVMCEGECFGVIYANNSLDHERYSFDDLDYLILISLTTGAFIKNL